MLFADVASADTSALYQALTVFATALVMAGTAALRQWIHDRRQAALAENTNKTVKQVHHLVNGGMLAQLRANATLARRLADTTKDPADLAAAKAADETLAAHVAKLTEIYGQPPPTPAQPEAPVPAK